MRIKHYLWITPFVSFLFGYLLLSRLFCPNEFTTPSIVGKQLLQAVSILSDHTLHIKIMAQKEDPDLPQGTILSQKPLPGRKIKDNQTVYVVLSVKPPKIPCPTLINKQLESILPLLQEKHIHNKSYFLSSNYPCNTCISQHPRPLTPLKENKVITYISQGNKKPIILPNFKNKKIINVVTFLKDYNTQVQTDILYDTTCRSAHTDNKHCIVSDQRPLAGSIIHLGKKPITIHLKVVRK